MAPHHCVVVMSAASCSASTPFTTQPCLSCLPSFPACLASPMPPHHTKHMPNPTNRPDREQPGPPPAQADPCEGEWWRPHPSRQRQRCPHLLRDQERPQASWTQPLGSHTTPQQSTRLSRVMNFQCRKQSACFQPREMSTVCLIMLLVSCTLVALCMRGCVDTISTLLHGKQNMRVQVCAWVSAGG